MKSPVGIHAQAKSGLEWNSVAVTLYGILRDI